MSELFTSQTDDPDTILQNTRINIRLLDCDSFPAYHFLNYLGRSWTALMSNEIINNRAAVDELEKKAHSELVSKEGEGLVKVYSDKLGQIFQTVQVERTDDTHITFKSRYREELESIKGWLGVNDNIHINL